MFAVLRSRLSYANVAATLALLFAMSGGALAASKFLITSTKQIKPSVLAQLKGRNGKDGAAGAQGPAGPQGAQGPQGPVGANGKDGAPGTAGPAGPEGAKGATGANGSPGPAGQKGATGPTGSVGPTGVAGPTGPEGSPWTQLGMLPKGQTETGAWAVNIGKVAAFTAAFEPISIPVQTKEGGEAFFLNAKETAEKTAKGGCAGTVAAPTAPVGKLCVYTEEQVTKELNEEPTVFADETPEHFGKAGGFIQVNVKPGGEAIARGTWAVTAG